MLIERYNEVKEHVKEACERVGRDPREVTVIAVSKTKPLEMVEELRKEKVLDFGENKVQEIRDKYANISWPVRWHLIGHLQTNKIKYIVDKVALIHSVDSVKLAQAIDKEAVKHNVKEVPFLIQVNFAHEDTRKYFRAMKQLSVDIKNKNFDNVNMSILSMGMTNDYEIAVEEGATMIRVGTAIFCDRNYNI